MAESLATAEKGSDDDSDNSDEDLPGKCEFTNIISNSKTIAPIDLIFFRKKYYTCGFVL